MTKENWVLGLDGCPAGWAGICWSGTKVVGVFRATVVSVLERATRAIENAPIAVIGVDMFVGLPDHSVRRADALARRVIGPRRSSVFNAPVRAALEATTYSDALVINREMTGQGFSAQAFAVRKKALEIDRFVHDLKVPLIEVHPEVTFTQMNGEPLLFSKKTHLLNSRNEPIRTTFLMQQPLPGRRCDFIAARPNRSHRHPRFSLMDYRPRSGSETSAHLNGR